MHKSIAIALAAASAWWQAALAQTVTNDQGVAPACDRATVDALLDPNATDPFFPTCSVTLPENITIHRSLIFEGSPASHSVLDCNGSTIDTSAARSRDGKIAIIVRSKKAGSGSWDPPKDVTVRNCTIKGVIRIYGMDVSANGENMHASSRRENHTEFAQASAPRGVSFLNLSIIAPNGTPLYIGPGSTWTTLANSHLSGDARGTVIYMDAESGYNSIRNNQFSIITKSRELIAIDGSTRNEIVGNTFDDPVNGGVFVYRNCGEAGTIRHQQPDFNTISNNTFVYRMDGKVAKPAVWLGSRQGRQKVCFTDPKYPLGSSLSPLDFAQNNRVTGNRLIGGSAALIRDSDKMNTVQDNVER